MARFSICGFAAVSLVMTTTTVLAQTIQLTLPTNPPQTLTETISRTFTGDLPPLTNDLPSATTVTTCPTIVSTTKICSECATIACVVDFTVTAPCGCPTDAVTIFKDHPCGIGCAGLEGCQTGSIVVTPTDCSSASGASSSTGSASDSATKTSESPTETDVSSTGAGTSGTESESRSTTLTITTTDTETDTPSAPPVSTVAPTSTTSTAAAARLAPFRLW